MTSSPRLRQGIEIGRILHLADIDDLVFPVDKQVYLAPVDPNLLVSLTIP